jgi:hypothetical protein
MLIDAIARALVLSVGFATFREQPTLESRCPKESAANCAQATLTALRAAPRSPQEVLRIATVWSQRYESRLDTLARAGQANKSDPFRTTLPGFIAEELNPISLAQDAAVDALAKKYFPRLASVLHLIPTKVAVPLKAFFGSTETATEYDELRNDNDLVQQLVESLLDPYFRSGWRKSVTGAMEAAAQRLPATKR